MNKNRDRGFSPEDSIFRDNRNREGDRIDRNKDAVDESTLRRIKFLRRLQNLKND